MQIHQRLSNIIRDVSPCKDCTERFTACWGKCPKDARGDVGYKAWRKKIEEVKAERKRFIENQQEFNKHIK